MAGHTDAHRISTLIERLNQKHPDARYELNYETPFQLLVATILAAQATDERINQVTPGLFAKYPDAAAFAAADRTVLEQDLKPTGFYRNKAKAVQECSQALVERFGGEVPPRMEDLVTLPGVARKTANVVLNNAFRIASGVIVDTHVLRVSGRLGLTEQTRPEKIEQDLMRLIPQSEWVQFGPALVLHGRYTCTAHRPKCGDCVFNDFCPRLGVEDTDGVSTSPARSASAVDDSPALTLRTEDSAAPSLAALLPDDWRGALADEFSKPYFKDLEAFVAAERAAHTVFPPADDLFNAFRHTPLANVKVVLLGQDPYHDDGQAHGLCFSVRPGVKPPPSLVNIFKELHDDLGAAIPDNGCLDAWAERGVLLLNTVLTVRAHQPASHKDKGWETFTDAVLRVVSGRAEPTVFLLWGAFAHKKEELIDRARHVVLKAAHPSPLSAKKFFGSKPFSQANAALERLGRQAIDWNLTSGAAPTPPPPKEEPPAMSEPEPSPVAALGRIVAALQARTEEPPPAPPAPAVAPKAPPAPELSPLTRLLPDDWRTALAEDLSRPYFRKLEKFLDAERAEHDVFPAADVVFRAFALTPLEKVKVVLLGEEPYARKGLATGLAYSLAPGVAPTPAVVNLLHELRGDLGCWVPRTGCLEPWTRQGVLLLDSVLTVRAAEPASHRERGWENFTDAVVRLLNQRAETVVFVLCGSAARKEKLVDTRRHAVVAVPDPSGRGFLGTRPFSAVNNALQLRRRGPVYWQIYAP